MTKKEFLSEYAQHSELAKKALKQSGLSWKEIKEHPSDFYDPSSGSVPGFIYYVDTVKFAKKNLVLIQNALNDFENECGVLNKPTDDETQYYNWLAWFAWENTMSDVLSALDR
jgi:Na+-transporting NADH:ubiquinone oxidoreductase subunit NqrA